MSNKAIVFCRLELKTATSYSIIFKDPELLAYCSPENAQGAAIRHYNIVQHLAWPKDVAADPIPASSPSSQQPVGKMAAGNLKRASPLLLECHMQVSYFNMVVV